EARAALDDRHMPRVAGGGHDHAPLQCQETHLLNGPEAVVVPELIRQRRRDVFGGLVQAAIPLLSVTRRARRGVRLHFRPQRLVGGPDLTGTEQVICAGSPKRERMSWYAPSCKPTWLLIFPCAKA